MLLTALALMAASQDDRWAFLGSDTLFSAVEVDRQSIRRSGDKITIWVRQTFGVSQNSMLREVEMDCGRRTMTVSVIIWREANGASRRTDFEAFQRTADSIDPESAEERVFVAVCG